MGAMTDRLIEAMNAHDLDALVACFSEDYRSEQPAHPSRSFAGRNQVRENWSSVFAGIPDFHAELILASTVDAVEIAEWIWRGSHTDGSPFAMGGVTVMGIEAGHIAWGRLYMEAIDRDGVDIDQMVREAYRPPGGQ
jgi:hypothetical protein